jgi:hypothetical protein
VPKVILLSGTLCITYLDKEIIKATQPLHIPGTRKGKNLPVSSNKAFFAFCSLSKLILRFRELGFPLVGKHIYEF